MREEALDSIVPHNGMFAVRPRKTNGGGFCLADNRQCAEYLHFLAAHHIWNAFVVAANQTRTNECISDCGPRHRLDSSGKLMQSCWTLDVRHLKPSLTAAHHSAHQDRA